MTDHNKKNWVKPELIEIVRCKIEESVLDACKVDYNTCRTEAKSLNIGNS